MAALPARVKIVILDAARQNPLAQGGEPLASGLALVDPAPGTAIAFNAAPGTIVGDARDTLDVATGEGVLSIREVQREGGRRMSVRDYRNARRERGAAS